MGGAMSLTATSKVSLTMRTAVVLYRYKDLKPVGESRTRVGKELSSLPCVQRGEQRSEGGSRLSQDQNVGLLLAGSFLEPPAAILILTPLLLPIVRGVGVNPIHFGIIVAVNLSLGMYTPPFGLNLFSSQAIFNAPLGRIYLGVLPFLLLNFVALMIITYVPAISMVLLPH